MTAVPPAFSQPAAEGGRKEIAQEATAGRAHHVGDADTLFRRAGEDRKTKSAFNQIECQGRRPESAAERHSEPQDDKRLKCQGKRIESHLDLGRHGHEQTSHRRQHDEERRPVAADRRP